MTVRVSEGAQKAPQAAPNLGVGSHRAPVVGMYAHHCSGHVEFYSASFPMQLLRGTGRKGA